MRASTRSRRAAAIALCTGTLAYFYHQRWRHQLVFAATNSSQRNVDCEGKVLAVEPKISAKEKPLALQLHQVQVMFRHGARLPLHLTPKIEEVEYDPQFITREHQASLFPYQWVSSITGQPIAWSDYEQHLQNKPLRGGAIAGTLTIVGKDQMFSLGRRLRDCYSDRLGLETFDPEDVYIISSNVKRTVESARSVLAGIYGKEQLNTFAKINGPVKISITDETYNILIPDTIHCQVLKKVNHSAQVNPDFIPGMKRDRLAVEKEIDLPRQERMKIIVSSQNAILGNFGRNKERRSQEFNQHNQSYLRDSVMEPLYRNRGQAIEGMDRFWSSAMIRHPALSEIITEDDMKALIYLRHLEVEEFEGKFQTGYRFHLYFDSNPYFYNTHLCKEIYTKKADGAVSSSSTQIKWKPSRKLVPDRLKEKEMLITEGEDNAELIKLRSHDITKSPEDEVIAKSFFSWYTHVTDPGSDTVGKALKEEIWVNPLVFLKNQPKLKDPWDQPLNLMYGRDDMVCRLTHGWPCPQQFKKHQELIDACATKILYHAMTGHHKDERSLVTRLSAGPLLTYMVDRADSLTKGDQVTKLCLYSGHDSTMTAMLQALNIWDDKWPPFAADLRLEIYKEVEGKEFYIRVLYCGKVKKIRGQRDDFISWSDFKESIKDYIIRPNEYKKVCSSDALEKIAKTIHWKGEKVGEIPTLELPDKDEMPAGM